MENRVFLKATKIGTWEPVEFEKIKDGDKIKMIEMSPKGNEVLSEIWDVVKGYNSKTGIFEGFVIQPAVYLPITKDIKELFER